MDSRKAEPQPEPEPEPAAALPSPVPSPAPSPAPAPSPSLLGLPSPPSAAVRSSASGVEVRFGADALPAVPAAALPSVPPQLPARSDVEAALGRNLDRGAQTLAGLLSGATAVLNGTSDVRTALPQLAPVADALTPVAGAVSVAVAAQIQQAKANGAHNIEQAKLLLEALRAAMLGSLATPAGAGAGSGGGGGGAAGAGGAQVQLMLRTPAVRGRLLAVLGSPAALQACLASEEIRTAVVPLLSAEGAVAALLADPEIGPLVRQEACTAILLADPDIGPALRQALEAPAAGDDILEAALVESEAYTPAEGAPRQPAPQPAGNPLAAVTGMGFGEEEAAVALVECGGDAARAIERLLAAAAHQPAPSSSEPCLVAEVVD